jgi:hypothetical protein
VGATMAAAELTDAAGLKPEREQELLTAASRGEAVPPAPRAHRRA